MNELAGRFTESAMTAVMHEVADRLRVAADDAKLLRLTNNAVFALPAAGIVVRINRSYGLDERVYKVVRLARWFEQGNAPTIRLLPSVDQPLKAGALLVTVWQRIPPAPHPPTAN